MKDYCSMFPDIFMGKNLNGCCKKHDNDCGQRGDFNFIRHQIDFYKCLRTKLNIFWSIIITFGGTVLCLLKSPWLIYKKIKYRLENK